MHLCRHRPHRADALVTARLPYRADAHACHPYRANAAFVSRPLPGRRLVSPTIPYRADALARRPYRRRRLPYTSVVPTGQPHSCLPYRADALACRPYRADVALVCHPLPGRRTCVSSLRDYGALALPVTRRRRAYTLVTVSSFCTTHLPYTRVLLTAPPH